MSQQQIRKQARPAEEDVAELTPSPRQGEELISELDALLDEIDDLLEENASAFVKSYIQVGGQ